MLTLEEYIDKYREKGYLPDGQYANPEKKLNHGQLKFKYEKYVRRFAKKQEKTNTEYTDNIIDITTQCRREDAGASIFWNALSEEEAAVVENEMKKLAEFREIDPCHVFSKGSTPQLADNPLNILMAPRAWHYFIDKYLNPYSEKHEGITKEEHEIIWRRIIGGDRYDKLLELKRGK
jgi:hypothetical protein